MLSKMLVRYPQPMMIVKRHYASSGARGGTKSHEVASDIVNSFLQADDDKETRQGKQNSTVGSAMAAKDAASKTDVEEEEEKINAKVADILARGEKVAKEERSNTDGRLSFEERVAEALLPR